MDLQDVKMDIGSHRPLREVVYEELKRNIMTGRIVPGTRLMEVDLSNQMGVSRTPIREAKRITPEEINRLENITDNYELAVKHNDTEQMIFCDEQFHKEIVEITGNNTLVKFSTMAQELALRFRYIYYDDFSRYENMPSEHRGIIAALKSGDSTEARRVVSEHIKALRAFVIEGGKTGFRDKREF